MRVPTTTTTIYTRRMADSSSSRCTVILTSECRAQPNRMKSALVLPRSVYRCVQIRSIVKQILFYRVTIRSTWSLARPLQPNIDNTIKEAPPLPTPLHTPKALGLDKTDPFLYLQIL